jgi:serine/threonine-protein phosphatase 2B catalytic subunit
MKDIMPPPHRPLNDELLYPNKSNRNICKEVIDNIPNWEILKSHLYREGRITKEHCQKLLRDTLALISILKGLNEFLTILTI